MGTCNSGNHRTLRHTRSRSTSPAPTRTLRRDRTRTPGTPSPPRGRPLRAPAFYVPNLHLYSAPAHLVDVSRLLRAPALYVPNLHLYSAPAHLVDVSRPLRAPALYTSISISTARASRSNTPSTTSLHLRRDQQARAANKTAAGASNQQVGTFSVCSPAPPSIHPPPLYPPPSPSACSPSPLVRPVAPARAQ
jgi:hypothetical protein